ncbi:hypothetical protein AB2L28_10640 [Kineococcus sp. TBRC 1896]|uniref:Uncharacterized protein n=1 Tax=Kineococcus mangrovi TaxID=1660183 RepID=A0ABV4I200_9ACTN
MTLLLEFVVWLAVEVVQVITGRGPRSEAPSADDDQARERQPVTGTEETTEISIN